jgi:hypothetical protein
MITMPAQMILAILLLDVNMKKLFAMTMMHVLMILAIQLTDVITQKYGAMIMTHVLLIGAIVAKVAKLRILIVMTTTPVQKTLVISKLVANTN